MAFTSDGKKPSSTLRNHLDVRDAATLELSGRLRSSPDGFKLAYLSFVLSAPALRGSAPDGRYRHRRRRGRANLVGHPDRAEDAHARIRPGTTQLRSVRTVAQRVVSRGGIQLIDMRSGRSERRARASATALIRCCSPRTARRSSPANPDSTLTRWDVASATPSSRCRHSTGIRQAVFAPTGRRSTRWATTARRSPGTSPVTSGETGVPLTQHRDFDEASDGHPGGSARTVRCSPSGSRSRRRASGREPPDPGRATFEGDRRRGQGTRLHARRGRWQRSRARGTATV